MKFSYLCLIVLIALIATTTLADQDVLKAKFAKFFTPTGEMTPELKAEVCKFNSTSFEGYKGADWIGTNPTDPDGPDHYKYTMTFCGDAAEAKCGAAHGSLCQYDNTKAGAYVNSLASFTAQPAPVFAEEAGGVKTLTFTNGDRCYSGWSTVDRTVVFKFTCDRTKKERTFIVAEPSTCTYEIDFVTSLACGNGGGSDGIAGGTIFLIIVFSVFLFYIIAGCAICIVKFGQPFGISSCPHNAFWCALPGFFVAGCGFTFKKIKGCFGGKTITTSSGEYEEA